MFVINNLFFRHNIKRLLLFVLIFCIQCATVFIATTSFAGISPLQISLYPPIQLTPESWSIIGLRLSPIYGRNINVYGLDIGLFSRTTCHQGGIQLGLINLAYSTEAPFYGESLDDFLGSPKTYNDEPESLMTGIQFALGINYAGYIRGIQIAQANQSINMSGIQCALFVIGINENFNRAKGIQVSYAVIGKNAARDISGGQLVAGGFAVNIAEHMHGVQFCAGLLPMGNVVEGEMAGVQIGPVILNGAMSMSGVQLFGIINIVENTMNGVQLGIINYANELNGVQLGLLNIVHESPVPFLPIINMHF